MILFTKKEKENKETNQQNTRGAPLIHLMNYGPLKL